MLPRPHRRVRTLEIAAFVFLLATATHAQDAPQTSAIRPTVSARQGREADDAYLAGARELQRNNPAVAQEDFTRALSLDPGKPEYALSLAVAKEHHVTALIQAAAKARLIGHAAEAGTLFAQARALDPDNVIVTQHLDQGALPIGEEPGASSASDQIAKLGGPIHLQPTAGTQSFHLRGNAQDILREVYTAYGIRPTFDSSVTTQSLRFDLDDADFNTATRVLLNMTHIFATALDAKSALLAKDTQENRDRLVPQIEETFYVPGLTPEQLTELSNVAKNVFDLKQVAVQASGSRIVIRGNEDAMKLVNATFADLLDGGGEVLLEVRLYEVDKTHMRNIGADFPTSVGAFSIAAEATSLVNANQSILQQAIGAGLLVLDGKTPLENLLKELEFLIASGTVNVSQYATLLGTIGGGLALAGVYLGSGATFNMMLNSTDVHMLDDIQMRVGDNKLGTFRSGTRYPITTSTYSSAIPSSLTSALSGVKINGSSAASLLSQYLGGSTATTPQIQYEDLGVTLKATPQVLKSGQVHVQLDMKIEALGAGSLNGIPVLNQRQVISDVTIPVGGTAMLASEVSTTEARTIDGIPGISEIPGFQGTERSVEKDTGELLITITPTIVRKRSSVVASRRLVANVSVVEQ